MREGGRKQGMGEGKGLRDVKVVGGGEGGWGDRGRRR